MSRTLVTVGRQEISVCAKCLLAFPVHVSNLHNYIHILI